MSLKVNVGLSKKSTLDFQSEGQSISIESELDPLLLTKPGEFQAAIESLYAQAREALEGQAAQRTPAAAPQAPHSAPARPAATPAPRVGHTAARQALPPANRNGTRPTATAGRVDGNAPPLATDSQFKAIRAIAQGIGVDPEAESNALGFQLPLGRGDASRLIDHLKSLQSPPRAAA